MEIINKFPMLIVGVVVALVLAGAVLPVFAETTSATDTFKNDGYFRMSELNIDSDYTVSWDYTNPTIITINGTEIDMSFLNVANYSSVTIFATDTYVIRAVHATGTQYNIQKYGGTFAGAGSNTEKNFSATISGISASLTFGTEILTETITEGYIIDPRGTYIMKKNTTDAYIHSNSSIVVLAGVSGIAGGDVTIYATGTVDDGLTFSAIQGVAGATYSFGEPAFNTTTVSNYVDLDKISSVEFDFIKNDTTATFTYSYFIVPYEVTAEKSIHPDEPLTVLLNVLPLLAIAGLVAGSVAWFITRK